MYEEHNNNVKFDDCAKTKLIDSNFNSFEVRNESENLNGVDKRAVGVMSHVLYEGNGHPCMHVRVN